MPDGTLNPKWLDERRKGVTATEAAQLLSGGSWMALWAEKTGRVERNGSAANNDERAYWGTMLESKVLEAYSSERYAGRPVERVGWLVRSKDHPWLMATLDARTRHPDAGWIPLDAKTTDKYLESRWENGPPKRYAWQIRAQAVVEGTKLSSIACLLGGNRLVWADDALTGPDYDRVCEVTERFYWHMQHDVPPDAFDPLPETKRALDRTFSPREGTVIELPISFAEMDMEYEGICEMLDTRGVVDKELRARKDAIENAIRRAMENSAEARTPNGALWAQKRVERKAHEVKASSFNQLRRKGRV
jgi:predicted phage-related endonuclease